MKKWALIIDAAKCSNCGNCVLATMDEHIGNDHPGYAAAQPPRGHAWIDMHQCVRGDGTMVNAVHAPIMCNHCDNAPCVRAAGDGSVYQRPDGIVIMDPRRSRGRRDIVDACPYGAAWWNDEERIPQIWIFDAHLLDRGWRQPRCVQACPTGAIRAVKVERAELEAMIEREGLCVRHPEYGTSPRVYYKNYSRFLTCFLGGNVTAIEDGRTINVPGAAVSLMRDGTVVAEASTDEFGDFRIDGLTGDRTEYTLHVVHERHGQVSGSVRIDRSRSVGPVLLSRAVGSPVDWSGQVAELKGG